MTSALEQFTQHEIDRFRSGEISAAYLLQGWVCNNVGPNRINRQPVLEMLTDDYTEHAVQWVRDNVPTDTVGYAAILEAVGGAS